MTFPDLQKAPPGGGTDLLSAFPGRAIVVHYAGVLSHALLMAGLGLLFGAITGFALHAIVPDIVNDAAMNGADEALVEPEASVDGSCKRMKFVFIDCNAKITYRPDPARADSATVEQSFMFLGTSYSTTVDVLRSKAHPAMVTTTLATEHLTNRIVTLALLGLILGGLTVGTLREAWLSFQRRRLQGKALVLRPVIATIVEADEHRNVTFEARVDGVAVKGVNRLRDGDAPLYLLNSQQVLAVALPGTRHMILIDHDLTVLDFTDDERARIRAALQ